MTVKEICSIIDERQEELYALLSNLIKINSENFQSYGNEAECAEFVKKLCEEKGFETELYSPLAIDGFENHPDYFPERNLENRPNVTAKWKGEADEDYLMLMAHTDTVRIGDPANWTVDPLGGEIKDGKIWGRGATDDKYGVATAIFVMGLLKEKGIVPKKNVLFSAYSDEEYGGSHGALAASLRYPAERIVNLDCKDFEIWHCASGGGEVKYKFHTESIVDTAYLAGRAIPIVMDVLEKFGANRKAELDSNHFYKGTIIPETSFRYMGLKAGDSGADLGRGEAYFVFYTDKTKEEIWKEFRVLEKEIAEKLLPLGIIGDGFEPNTRFFHYTFIEADNSSIIDMQKAALEATGRQLTPCASCLSDLSVIQKYGSPNAYGFGIGRSFREYGGSHQPDEYMPCERILEYAKIIAAYVVNTLC